MPGHSPASSIRLGLIFIGLFSIPDNYGIMKKADCGSRGQPSDGGSQITDCGFLKSDIGLPISDLRLLISDIGYQIADF